MNLEADCWYLEKPEHIKNKWFMVYLFNVPWLPIQVFGKGVKSLGKMNTEFIPKDPIHETPKGEEGSWLFRGNKQHLKTVTGNLSVKIQILFFT